MDRKSEWITLEQHIQDLLIEGKRSQSEEFKQLFRIFGMTKVAEIARRLLPEVNQQEKDKK